MLSSILLATTGAAGCNAQSGDARATNQSSQLQPSEAGLEQVRLTIKSQENVHNFIVELAQTREQQSRGLMFRKVLAPDKGMIFPFAEERMASFWMKNTVIPLDIIFVRKDGSIESIAASTTPYSLDSVASREPVAAVLELAGGRAAELAIGPGDIVTWPQ